MEGSGSNPFSIFDQLTAARAAMEVEEVERMEVGVDQARIRRDIARREEAVKPLRARPRTRNRPNTSRVIRGHMEDPGAAA